MIRNMLTAAALVVLGAVFATVLIGCTRTAAADAPNPLAWIKLDRDGIVPETYRLPDAERGVVCYVIVYPAYAPGISCLKVTP